REGVSWVFDVLGHTAIGIWDWDITRDVVTWNDNVYAIFGIDRTRFGANLDAIFEMTYEEDKPTLAAALDRVLKEGEASYAVTYRMVHGSGGIRWIQADGAVNRDATGKPYRLAGIVRDATEEKKAQDERYAMQQHIIEAQEALLRQLGAPIIPLTAN